MKLLLTVLCVLCCSPVFAGTCGGVAASSCGGVAAASCGGVASTSATVYRRAPIATMLRRIAERRTISLIIDSPYAPASCSGVAAPVASCGGVPTNQQPTLAPLIGKKSSNSNYQIALRSAQYRAAHGIKRHTTIESNRLGEAGVGWSPFDPTPETCLGTGGSGYAVARGRDGWYSTKVR